MADLNKPRLVGFNHVAIEVGDIDQALDFYGSLFSFELRSREPGMAFIDLGDQFLALQETNSPLPTGGRHFGLVVEDKEAARTKILEAGITVEPGPNVSSGAPKTPHPRNGGSRSGGQSRPRPPVSTTPKPRGSGDPATGPGF